MLREFLYVLILVCGTSIFTGLDVLHYHEAFLVSGVLAILALLLVEPSGKAKSTRALILLSILIGLYGLGLKLPMLLLGRLNCYLTYLLVFVLVAIVNLIIFVLTRRYAASSRG